MSRRTVEIITCNVCGLDLTGEGIFTTAEGKDICPDCMERLVNDFFKNETIMDGEPKKETIKMVTIDKIISRGAATAQEEKQKKHLTARQQAERDAKYDAMLDEIDAGSRKDKKRKEPSPETARLFDSGKEQALRNAGWPIKKIAEEMRCCPATVYNNTYPPVEKQKKDLEFVDDDLARLGCTDTDEIKEVMQ